jgi:hypothetical protein
MKKDKYYKILLVLSIVLFLSSITYYFLKRSDKNNEINKIYGKQIPNFKIRDENKNIYNLFDKLASKPVHLILIIKRQECNSCLESIKELCGFYNKYYNKIDFIILISDILKEHFRNFIRINKIDIPVYEVKFDNEIYNDQEYPLILILNNNKTITKYFYSINVEENYNLFENFLSLFN